jgi:hypothetical protein
VDRRVIGEFFLPPLYLCWMSFAATRRQVRRKYVHRKLILRLRLFALIGLGMCGAVTYQVLAYQVLLLPTLAAAGTGLLVGLVVGRLSKVLWHEEATQVVAKMDRLGGVVLAAYLVLALSRRWVLGHWFAGHQLTAVTLAFTGGVMMGRLVATRREVVRVLKSQRRY